MANPFEFIQQVRTEATKVVWPSRRETLITTGLVMLMALFASLFLIVVDEVLRVSSVWCSASGMAAERRLAATGNILGL